MNTKRDNKENQIQKKTKRTMDMIKIRIKRKDKEEIEEQKEKIEKAPDRVEVLKKIEQLEREGKFDIDVENDPPTIVLTPDNIDYLRTTMTSKLKRIFANEVGERFLDS